MAREGIIVGSDQNQEWLLPLWWDHYSEHNLYPVAFADFGMSERSAAWCRERGHYFLAPHIETLERKPVSSERKQLWEKHFGKGIWFHREICLRKPFVMLQTPFPLSIWIDLDCRIRGNLAPLFALLHRGVEIGMRKEDTSVHEIHRKKGFLRETEIAYNSGVIPYRQDAPILRDWIEQINRRSEEFIFDQHAFGRALQHRTAAMVELPEIYNWSPGNGPNPNALIYHFHGAFLKDPAFLFFFP